MKDEIWTMRDGTKIAVGDMDEGHVRNALRMILRQRRERAKQRLYALIDNFPGAHGWDHERPDNHQELAQLRARHGDAVRVEGKSVAGMGGADVFVGDRWVGWFGGISK